MLSQLSIKNIVLIESAELAFGKGLCVLSGETGAGKSILLDALGLALGARADAGLIRQGEKQGSISAEFDISANESAKAILAELEIEADGELIIRRSLSSDGKTRCLANDQPITVSGLKRLGETLVEIHGQHDQRDLQDASVHRELVDNYGAHNAQKKKVASVYSAWQQDKAAIKKLQDELEKAQRDQDYLQHMRAELRELDPQEGEEEELTTKRATMMQSEKLFEVLNGAISELNQGRGAIATLNAAQRALTRSPLTTTEAYQPIIDGLEKAAIETEEALFALEKAGEEAIYDPAKLEMIEERLFALKAAGRKYNVAVDDLAQLYADTERKLEQINTQDTDLRELKQKEAESKKLFVATAEKLSEMRAKAAAKLEKNVAKELAPLKMEGTKFRVNVEKLDEAQWSSAGMDNVHFECATNVSKGAKEVRYASLKQIASGGELSRFMLALKVVLSSTRNATTLIFDEIDTGTGGAVADAIGARLAKLGGNAQVLVVTHLPQVAARGSQHLKVSKSEKGKKILTQVDILSAKEREEELARMLAGAKVTAEARKAAQKLLEEAA
ncbi:MAG: DNA repair protein RecN [Rickettsiales bacterium]